MKEMSRNCLVPVLVDEECSVPPDILKITYVSISDPALIERLKARIGQYKEINVVSIYLNSLLCFQFVSGNPI